MRGKRVTILAAAGTSVCVLASAAWSAQKTTKTAPRAATLNEGKKIFERHCSLCHGIDGRGGRGPALNRGHLSHAPDDDALKRVIGDGIPPQMPGAWFLSEGEVRNVAAFVQSLSKLPAEKVPGDAENGARIYARSGCAACHVLEGAGQGYGPELTGIGERRNSAFLKRTLENPAAALPEDFVMVKATTDSGQTVEGIRVNEDSFTIQVRDAGGHYYSLRKDALKSLEKKRDESPMPAFGKLMGESDLQDLVAYLASRRSQR